METQLRLNHYTPTTASDSKPSVLNLLQCKCPRCRRGAMFTVTNPWKLSTTMQMNRECAVCKQPLNIEVGFYYGTGYVSYALSIAFTVATFIAWWIFVGLSVDDNRIFWWLGLNSLILLIIQPYLMRLSRTLWLAFFVWYDKNWRTNPPKKRERVNEAQENNW